MSNAQSVPTWTLTASGVASAALAAYHAGTLLAQRFPFGEGGSRPPFCRYHHTDGVVCALGASLPGLPDRWAHTGIRDLIEFGVVKASFHDANELRIIQLLHDGWYHGEKITDDFPVSTKLNVAEITYRQIGQRYSEYLFLACMKEYVA